MTKMKRLLCIVSCMNAGGAETFLMKIYRHLNRDKYQMDFCVNGQGLYDDEIKEMGGKIFIIPPKSKNPFKTFNALKNIVKENGYDYVIRVNEHSLSTLDLLAAKKGGAKNLIMRSSNASTLGKFNTFLHKLFFFMPRCIPTLKIAPSSEAGVYTFGKKAVKNGEVVLLHNALSTDDYRFSQEKRNKYREEFAVDGKFVIGHVGRFNIQKNHDFLIEVFKEFCETNSNAVLLLIGKGELQNSIKEKVEKLNLTGKVVFTGVRTDVKDIFSAMDVFLFPSFFEGMPNTVIEAQTSGLPCLISNAITPEARVTDLVEFESLKNDAKVWSNRLMEMKNKEFKNRELFADEMLDKGYDIEETAKYFEKIVFESKNEENK